MTSPAPQPAPQPAPHAPHPPHASGTASFARTLTGDPLTVLLKHDHWATHRLLEACVGLTGAQFHHPFEIGLGNLHDTLTHIIGAMRRWADRIDQRVLRPSIEARASSDPVPTPIGRSPRELTALLDDAAADLASVATKYKDRLSEVFEVKFGPRLYHFSRGAALVHVTTHGGHHRAQCVNMLRHLKIEGLSGRLPEVAVTEWQAEVEAMELPRWTRV